MEGIIKNLVSLRRSKRIRQDVMAGKLRLNKQTLSNYENGKSGMPLRVAIDYADIVGCEIRLLFKDKGK